MDILSGLNPAQREAAQHIQGPLLILAGPGSGKTRVITHRIAYLIKTVGISPRRIMAVTFTNKAAREMMERVEKLLGQAAQGITLGTFHAICARILRTDGAAIGLDSHFVIYDDDDQISLIKQSLKDLNLDPKQYPPGNIAGAISAAKNQSLTPSEYAERAGSYFEEVVQRVYERYQQLLDKNQGVDFDDLLMKAVRLFAAHPEVLRKYAERYVHILVDEFQDTNTVQYRLVKQLAGKHRNLCVVGDPDQSIYSWRFADIRNILSFEKDFPDAKTVFLEQNYRSTRRILEVASNVIAANLQRKEKALWTENEDGIPVALVKTYDERSEATFVANEIEGLVARKATTHRGCAVMYRVNAQSRALEETFLRYGIPYRLIGGIRFYQRREIKDIIAYLRLIHNPNDDISLARIINVPARGIGERTVNDLSALARSRNTSMFDVLKRLSAKELEGPFKGRTLPALTAFASFIDELIGASRELPIVSLMDKVIKDTGYQEYLQGESEEDADERWENLMELCTVARDFNDLPPEEALNAFLERVALVSDTDELEFGADAVTLITLHQAKGLEYPAVFIVGLEEGLLPHRKSFDDPGQMEEERRLCYVGITRAQKRLYLVAAYRRALFGGSVSNPISRFIEDIPPKLLAGRGETAEEGEAKEAKPAYQPRPTWMPRAGDFVRHSFFGEGQVVLVNRIPGDTEVTVVFKDKKYGIKKLLKSLAPMEKAEAPEE
ncbi:MAG: UvrD-helicase domain-containing protein [Chloroflexota bacterium]